MMKKLFPLLFLLPFLAGCKGPETPDSAAQFTEPHRPQLHFTPPAHWMNDPNGMVFFEGEYHLFYQYYPDSTVWGPMHWGHAVSPDLVHWEHLPIALYPDSLGYIFSGSAVVDWNNTSGFGDPDNYREEPPLIAIYTYHDPVGEKAGREDFQYQAIAYSNDRGRTWTKYAGNPVIPNPGIRDYRDTKVFWHKDSGQWIMVFAAWDHLMLWGSPDLKHWTHLSDFGREWGTHAGVWECPDLFPLKVESRDETKWVLIQNINPGALQGGSGTQYFIGNFDGKNFTVDPAFAEAFGTEPAQVPPGEVFADFESEDYSGWTTEGDAFGNGPARGTLPGQAEITGYTGHGLASSFANGDAATGKLISPEFTIANDFINFQIGGGNDKLRLSMNLVVDGKTTHSASGTHGEHLKWAAWDVRGLIGRKAHFEIIDNSTGGWGHLNVDQIAFAGKAVRPAMEKAVWLDYGRDNYAGVTWSDIPEEDGRRIFMGWMSNWNYAQVVPTEVWRSAMTLPRRLTLRNTAQGLRLFARPVKELEQLRQKNYSVEPASLTGDLDLTDELGFPPALMEVVLEVELPEGSAAEFGVALSNDLGEEYRVGFEATTGQFYSDRTKAGESAFSTVFAGSRVFAPRIGTGRKVQLHLFFDVASCELFADDGATVMTEIFFPHKDYDRVKLFADGGEVNLLKGEFYGLKSIWQ
ncbi:MAG: glycoside hydrolase family 32 protein [Saprospiraceae bacterium]